MSAVALPGSLAEVTPAWLSAALSTGGTRAEVTSVDAEHTIDGTATKVRLRLGYRTGTTPGLPEHLWIKGGYGRESTKVMPTGAYATEARFYRDLCHQLPVTVPACYFADCDEHTLQGVVLIEDLGLAGVEFCRAPRPLTADQAARVLELLAGLHAHWWNAPELDALAWLRAPLEPGSPPDSFVARFTPRTVDDFLALPRAGTVPTAVTGERVLAALHRLRADSTRYPRALLHGDTHLGNLYLRRDGTPGLLDWQTVWRGSWAHDVAYFLTSALEVDARRTHEQPLLRHYLDHLAAAGAPAPDPDTAWREYRRHIAYGLFIWVVNPTEAQPDEVNIPNIQRFLAATEDLDPFAVLEV